MKRFWKAATVAEGPQGYTVELDGRTLMTPAKAPLVAPTSALAAGIAAEWNAQGEEVVPQALPLTRAANAAIDRVRTQHTEVAEALAAYADADLLCYRAPYPRELTQRQVERWDPWLDWAAERFAARLRTGQGVMHVLQPADAIAALRREVLAEDDFVLTGMHELVTLSGSLILGLAVRHQALSAAEAWALSRIEEDWQIAEWGEDAEAAAATRRREADFHQADRLLTLLLGQEPDNERAQVGR